MRVLYGRRYCHRQSFYSAVAHLDSGCGPLWWRTESFHAGFAVLVLLSTAGANILKSSLRTARVGRRSTGISSGSGRTSTKVFLLAGVLNIFFLSKTKKTARLNKSRRRLREKMKFPYIAVIFLLCVLGAAAQTPAAKCSDACVEGYASFRQWCLSKGPTARCSSLVNAPRQFNVQSCMRFCTD